MRRWPPPNKRLKLTGVIVSQESLCCALARTDYRSTTVAGAGGDARSLSAIR